jgi:ABC-type transport system substrate-binding protein
MSPFRVNPEDEFVQGVAIGFSVNGDATVYQVHFDPDAIFTDGTPFTAELAKASWEFGAAPEQQASWGGAINYVRAVEGMEAVGAGDATEAAGLVVIDDHTLEVRLTAPAFTFPFSLARSQLGFANMPLIEGDPDWRNHVPGIGQFSVTFDADKGEQDVKRSANFWRDPALLAGVAMPHVDDQQTRFIMFENGEADIGPNFAVREDPSHALYGEITHRRAGGCCWYVGFAIDKAPFEDMKVRAALAHAVDLETIVDAVYPGSFLASGIINGDLPCADPQKTPYEYDPEKARQLLAESTYGSAANLPPITVSLRNAQQIQIAVLTQEAWRDNLGVELTLHKRERGQTIPPEANLYRRSRGTSSPDVAELVWEMSHSDSTLHDDLGWDTDPGQAKIDALIDSAMMLPLDDPGRCDAFIEVERAMQDSYKFLPNSGVGSGDGNLVAPWVLGYQTKWYGDSTNLPYWKIGQRDRSLYPGHTWK